MPTYRYQCRLCATEFEEEHLIGDRQNANCPGCLAYGADKHTDAEGREVFNVEILMPLKVNIRTQDYVEKAAYDSREGAVDFSDALGPGNVVRNARELEERKKRFRDAFWESTDGAHETVRPFENPDGSITHDKVTTHKEGVDIGELVPYQDLEVGQTERDKSPEVRAEKGSEAAGSWVPVKPEGGETG